MTSRAVHFHLQRFSGPGAYRAVSREDNVVAHNPQSGQGHLLYPWLRPPEAFSGKGEARLAKAVPHPNGRCRSLTLVRGRTALIVRPTYVDGQEDHSRPTVPPLAVPRPYFRLQEGQSDSAGITPPELLGNPDH